MEKLREKGKPAKVCVFGATGFIGSAITQKLEQEGYDWVGVSRSVNSSKIVQAPLSQTDRLQNLISEYPVVINAMGAYKPEDFELNTKLVFQDFWENLQAFSKLLASSKVAKLLHISSGGTVYGETAGVPARESDWLKPISWYGKAKVIEESMLERVALQCGFQYLCARVSNPFGNSCFTKHGFVDVLLNMVKRGGVFNTFNNSKYCRDFIHAKDMAEVILALIEAEPKSKIEIFNVGSGKSICLHDVLKETKSLSPNFEYRLDRLPTDYDVVESVLNVSKLRDIGINTHEFITVTDYLKGNLRD